MCVILLVPLIIQACAQVCSETDVVLGKEGDIEDLSLEVVAVEVGGVGAVRQERQLNVGLGVVAVETTILIGRVLDKKSCAIAEY